jgi:hypothetical protein
MYLLLTTYKVAPWTPLEIALQIGIALVFLYIVIKLVNATSPKGMEQNREKHRAKRLKRYKRNRTAPSLPSESITV